MEIKVFNAGVLRKFCSTTGKSLSAKFLIFVDILSKEYKKKKEISKIHDLNIVFMTQLEIQKINNDFRAKNEPTDVLSFDVDEWGTAEIYICIEYIKEQLSYVFEKEPDGGELYKEVLRMVLHGFLHILGYSHMDKLDYGDPAYSFVRKNPKSKVAGENASPEKSHFEEFFKVQEDILATMKS